MLHAHTHISSFPVILARRQHHRPWIRQRHAYHLCGACGYPGGFQGARGCGNNKGQTSGCGSQFYVENVLEELDAEREWFYNRSTKILYAKSIAMCGDDVWINCYVR